MILMAVLVAGAGPAVADDCGDDPGNDDLATATPLSGCGSIDAAIDCVGDQDVYSFDAPIANTYSIRTTGTTDTELWIYDDAGQVVASDDDSGPDQNAAVSVAFDAGGTYYISVGEYGNDAIGSYWLEIEGCTLCGDDPGDDTIGNASAFGDSCGSKDASIDCTDDVDIYAFRIPADGSYTFSVSAVNATIVSVGNGSSWITENSNTITRTYTANAQIYVKVEPDTAGQVFDYTLSISGCPSGCGNDPGNDNLADATPLSGCGTTDAAIDCPGDLDYYSLTAPNGGSFTFETTGSTDTQLRLYDANGDAIATDDDSGSGSNARIVHTLTAGARYSIAVNEYNNDGTGDYALVVSGCSSGGCPGDPGNDTIGTATPLAGCGTISEAINCTNDIDYFSFTAQGAGTYRFEVSAGAGYLLTLYDDAGNVVAGPQDTAIAFSLTDGNRYHVSVEAGIQGGTFSYTLGITGCSSSGCNGETPNDDPSHATALPGCGTHDDQFHCAGDTDYFVFFTPSTGGTYGFETTGQMDTRLWLEDASGNVLAFDDDGGTGLNAHATVQLPAGSPVFVRVDEYNGNTGAYSLVVSGCGGGCANDPGNDSLGMASKLQGAGTYHGAFDCPGDVDYYGLTTTEGGDYTFETTGSMDTQVEVLDASGVLLASDDDSGTGYNARVTLSLPAGGWYAVRVGEYGNDDTGPYDLVVGFDPSDNTPAYEYLVPASARAAGVAGTNWSSDLVIVNVGKNAADVRIAALLRDRANPNPTVVSRHLGAGAMLRSADVLSDLFGITSGAAALVVTSNEPLVVASRTFNSVTGGTFGQFIPGIPSGRLVGPGSKVYLEGLVENASYRSNLGLVNMEDRGIDVTVRFMDAAGMQIGPSKTYALEPREYIQRTQVLHDVGASDVDLAWAELTATGTFAAYLSEVDFSTGDPIYRPVVNVPRNTEPVVLMGMAKVPGGAGTNWVSDGVFLNPGGSTATVQVDSLERGSGGGNRTVKFYLAPHNCFSAADILQSLFGMANGAASLVVRSDESVLVAGRTYNLIPSGTFGQNIPAMGPDQVLTPDTVGVLAMPRQDSAFRTNLGLMNNLSGEASTVDLVARDAAGAPIGNPYRVTLAPGEVTQLNAVLDRFGPGPISQAYLEIRVVSGSVLAYGSVVDQGKGDPVYELPSIYTP